MMEEWKKVAIRRIGEAIGELQIGVLMIAHNEISCPVCMYMRKEYGIKPLYSFLANSCDNYLHRSRRWWRRLKPIVHCQAYESCVLFVRYCEALRHGRITSVDAIALFTSLIKAIRDDTL